MKRLLYSVVIFLVMTQTVGADDRDVAKELLQRKVEAAIAVLQNNNYFDLPCPFRNGRFWFPARPERVFNRRHSALFRGLKTSENAAGGRKMPFMDGHSSS
jgi:hypothetical protein